MKSLLLVALAFCNINQLFIFFYTPHNDYIFVHLLNRYNTFQIVQKNQLFSLSLLPKVSEYDQEIAQSHTADQPTALRGRATEH